MKRIPRLVLQAGWPHALSAILLACGSAGVIAASSWSRFQTAGRLAIVGVVLFLIALALGSGRLVGLATLPVLAAATIATASGDDPAWIRAAVIAVLWYLAAELAWEAIERRDGVRRTPSFNNRRIDETNTIVLLSLAVTAAVFLLSSVAPARNALILAVALLGLAVALITTTRRLQRTINQESSREPGV